MVATGPAKVAPEADVSDALRSLGGELLVLIATQVNRAWIQLVVVTATMTLLLLHYVEPTVPVLWFAVVNIGGYAHLQLLLRLKDDASQSDEAKLKLVGRSFTLQALLRSSLPVLFSQLPLSTCAIISIYNLGTCAAVLYATSGYKPIYWPYCVATIAPMAIAWPMTGDLAESFTERILFVAFLLIFGVTMLGHAKGAYAHFESAYLMRRERLELNRQLRDALAKAESASHAKTRFLAAASHDLRQPIHALALFSGSLAMRPLDVRTAVIAEQIDKAIQVLGTQMDALLDISRLDAGVVEIRPAVIELRILLEQLAAELTPLAKRKGLRLSLRASQDLKVNTDVVLLHRIVSNLVTNAIKYTAAGKVEIILEAHGSYCRIKVRDTGPGIPAAEHQRIFEEFFQLENAERDRTKGLGLGLAIVSRLTALLEIKLQLHSKVGEGSSFELDLPIEGNPALPPIETAPATTDRPVPKGLSILVVDDEETIRLGMATLLEEMGFEVELAASSEGALQVAEHFEPDLVLADFRLQGEDNGMKTIDALRQRWPALPALLISGDTAPDRLQMAHAVGITLLHKPASIAQLRKAIAEAIPNE